ARQQAGASGDPHQQVTASRPGEQSFEQPEQDAGPSITQLATDPTTRLERDALMAMLQHPEAIDRDLVMRASQASFSNPSLAVVLDGIAAALMIDESGTDAFASAGWLERVLREVPVPFSRLVTE